MRNTKMLFCSLVIGLGVCGATVAEELPSEAMLWKQRTEVQKAAYIDGLCDAYKQINSPDGELFCRPLDFKGKQVPRLCAARWLFKDGGADPTPGVRIFDQFYADKNHSELPTWTVLAAYNDKACGENRALPRLVPMQAKLLCLRQLGEMRMSRYADSVVAAQEATCNTLK
jgi:hypothetical protein